MSKIALVADLHGNWPATLALDGDIRRRGVDAVWCLGDVVGKGPSSADTYDWAVQNCQIILLGNWDEGIGRKQFPRDEFYYNQLGRRRMEGLLDFPLEHTCVISGRRARFFHGRPIMTPLQFIQDEGATLEPLFAPDYQLAAYGDAHRQGMRLVGRMKQLINTGSVGNGLGYNMVQYVLLDGDVGGTSLSPLDVIFVTLPYDNAQAVRDAEKSDLPNKEAFIKEVQTGLYAR